MFFIAFSFSFILLAAIFVLVGAIRGRRLIWQRSLSKIITTVVAAILSALASLLVCWLGLKALLAETINGGLLGELSGLLAELPAAQTTALAFISMLVSPIFFLLFFAILRPITAIFGKRLARIISHSKKPHSKEDKKNEFKTEKGHWLSALLGGVSGLLLLCVLLVPAVGFCGIVEDIAPIALDSVSDGGSEEMAIVKEATEAIGTNVGTVTVRVLGGGLLYDLMTSYPTEYGFVTLRHETEFVGVAVNGVLAMADDELQKEEKSEALMNISESFDDSTLMPALLSELVGAASENWSRGEEFHGVACPLADSEFGPVMLSVTRGLANSDVETIKVDVRTIVEVFCTFIENDTMSSITENPLGLLSNEACTSEVLYSLLENPRLGVMVDGLSDFGVNMLMDALSMPNTKDGLYDEMLYEIGDVFVPSDSADAHASLMSKYNGVFDSYGIRLGNDTLSALADAYIGGTDAVEYTRTNIITSEEAFVNASELISADMITEHEYEILDNRAEADALAHAFAVMVSLKNDMDAPDFSTKTIIADLGPALDSFSATATIGADGAKYLLMSMLQSHTMRDSLGFSVLEATDTALSIANGAKDKKYDGMLTSLSLLVDVMDAASDTSKDTNAAVRTLLEDLTPESATVIQTIATPSVMVSNGVPERSSVPVSSLVSDTFGNLASAKEEKGMSDEEYERESAAVSNMMDVMMTATSDENKNKPMFGEGSSTGKTAKQFLDDVMNSSVMSQTMVEHVYGDGNTPASDPLNSENNPTDGDKTEFLKAVNQRWSEEPQKDGATQRKLISAGRMVNINVTFDGSAWVLEA